MLSPYTLLDLTGEKGELTSMVLGDLGADVIKVEPPAGSPSRVMGPLLENAPESERSLQYYAFNRNKRSVTLNLETEAGRKALFSLAEKADFIIESARPGEMARKGLGFEAMLQANPRIVYVAISPFGQDGPYADFPASDLTLAAMGGPMSLQGHPDRAPVRVTVPQVWLHASAEAAVGALTAHARMVRTGEAQFVDVSAQTAMVWTTLQAISAHGIQGFDFQRAGTTVQLGQISFQMVYDCADGYVVLFPIGRALAKFIEWSTDEGIVPKEWLAAEDWSIYHFKVLQGETLAYPLEEVVDTVRRWVSGKTKTQLLEQSLLEGVPMAPVSTTEELVRFRQLEERGYWLQAPLPNGQEVPTPGLLARLTETPLKVRRWAPKLGEHNQEILGGMLGLSASETAAACGPAGS